MKPKKKKGSDSKKARKTISNDSSLSTATQNENTGAPDRDELKVYGHKPQQTQLTSNEETTREGDSYRKRQIESNWAKYDIPEEGNDATGSELSLAFSISGGAGSHFSFQDEKDWGDDVESQLTNPVFALDLEDLAHSLACVPLHERLGIGAEYFTPETVLKFTAEAKTKQAAYEDAQKRPERTSNSQEKEYTGTEPSDSVHGTKQSILQYDDSFSHDNLPNPVQQPSFGPLESTVDEDELIALINSVHAKGRAKFREEKPPCVPGGTALDKEAKNMPASSLQSGGIFERSQLSVEDVLDSLIEND